MDEQQLAALIASLKAALVPLSEAPANVNATSALPDDVRESLAVDNIKAVAGGIAAYSAIAFGNVVAHQKRLDILAETAKVLTGKDVSDQILQIITALQATQTKAA